MVRKRETDPVMAALKASRKGDVIRVKAHLLNEENQDKIKDYVLKQDEISIFEVQGSIGMSGLRKYSPILCTHLDTLTRLSLPANNLTIPCVLDLVCALKLPENKKLELLDLSSNPIQSEGFKVLMSNLLLNTTLRALLLSKCSIGDQGVVASRQYFIGKRRTANSDFYINLSQNQIGPSGYLVITKSLQPWMSITLTRQKPPVVITSPSFSPTSAQDVSSLPSIGMSKEAADAESGGSSSSDDSDSDSSSAASGDPDVGEATAEEQNEIEEDEEVEEEEGEEPHSTNLPGDALVAPSSSEPDSETDDSRPSEEDYQTKRKKPDLETQPTVPVRPRGIPVRARCSLAIVSLSNGNEVIAIHRPSMFHRRLYVPKQ
eukprot:TRINITY_DN21658_c0_g1_i1.p1 TRINITY_DN21658_c0_g1~~TRINITY_DN21658_c0_g1_i1.p1  ORF type:complete len:375 (+),score=75.55 TRINITY_DN21658_c0_g1_i1:71-1195(+)